ncbi:MAG: ABC transporter permease [Clostridia bacterium]|nr:ABC transporter permease [Clostridia bacterium]
MKSKLKAFFSMIKFEIIRISRNKIILCFLFLFPILMALILSSFATNNNFTTAIYKDGLQDEQTQVIDLIQDTGKINNLIEVDAEEEGLELLKKGEIYFFISINANTEPISATFYYDDSNIVGRNVVTILQKIKTEYAYDTLTDFLIDYGITINEEYFNIIEFQTFNDTEIEIKQRLLPTIISSFVSIIIMLGLAFSISRDNETGVARQLSYTPVGINKYLFSKIIPYFLLAFFQTIILLILGRFLFDMNFAENLWLILLSATVFIIANISLGLLVCTVKNQTVSAFFALSTVLLPMLIISFTTIDSFPFIIQMFLYCLPITPYVILIKYLIFNAVFVPLYLVILILQTLVYYLLVLLIMKRRTGK